MSLLTENEVKKIIKENKDKIIIDDKTIITPSAKELIDGKKIKLIREKELNKVFKDEKENKKNTPKFKYIYGGYYDEKPEHLTQLFGNNLVPKNHKRIIFRGKIDSLESKILEVQVYCKNNKKEKLLKDLEDVLIFVRKILRAEVLDEELKDFNLIGLNEEEIHEMSHYPKKYFGIGHIFPEYTMGDYVIYLNSIRSLVRETEISAYNAFSNSENEISRLDIIKYLNRLSSCLYVMMFKYLSGKYN
ncbi:hypothetical protein OF820_03880 [Oceanotoga sp. DSM 15011]|jgi:ethanolamine utilization cobalamin adenosyltransferase|uniref:Ethanolamine utilization cobalamin adenosyltransferase n=1 Tax=Oceanotoga teriensis TaxID=515440 RepID=A0AA45C8D0_9BACT|nr:MULTISPECIES: cobalamin adenosyltransferase [Oceanotoga]MDN5341189.1 ethanolamine utilization cobalamin adenosyltransferase [Oceanotoga sp.]MDO7976870.1 hypothetical protein [Oceanotoga teriensis]PWJ95950.1 ethanolamine utilization cobalamin adenosyltransferase [Oceanotoga teriensis]UYP00827.1 hypothetical protein OF820_03880 [Oceanotoga sp. DSM 15011]